MTAGNASARAACARVTHYRTVCVCVLAVALCSLYKFKSLRDTMDII